MTFADFRRRNRERRKRVAHIFAGLLILIHAYEKYDSGHGSYIFFLIFGVVFTLIALFHHRLQKKFPGIDGVFFVIEGILSLIICYDYFHMGKKALPYCYLLIGIFQLIIAVVKSKHKKNAEAK
jgi:hypothetical protein